MIKMRASRTMVSKKPDSKKKTTSKTTPSTIAMPSPKKTAVNSLTEITVNQSASNKDTASLTLDSTETTDVSNMNVPQKKKLKKMTLLQRCTLVASQSARSFFVKTLMIKMSAIPPNPLTY
jgi:hypothetical protein